MDDMGKESASMQGQKVKTMWDVLTSRCARWQLLALVIPCAGIQFCGINTDIYFYTFDIFGEAGVAEDKMHYLSSGIGTTDLITITLCDLYSWFPYVNIPIIFFVICIYGLGPSQRSYSTSSQRPKARARWRSWRTLTNSTTRTGTNTKKG
nr:solute carrier family 2, facilitated glucose transporter member 9-like [Salvelinus alpinus]